jgi:hypothetical protein
MTPTWYRHFQRNGGLNEILRRQTSRFHYGSKVAAVTITAFITILEPVYCTSSMHQNIVSLTRDVTDGQTQHMKEMVNQEFSQRRRIGPESVGVSYVIWLQSKYL